MFIQIKDLGDMAPNYPIEKMRFKVKSAFPPKTGTSQYGEYTVQNATVADETGQVQAGFFDAAFDLRQFIGQEITVTSGMDGKGKPSGITTYDYTNKTGVVQRQLSISKNASISDFVAGAPSVSVPQQSGSAPTGVSSGTAPSAPVHFVQDARERQESFERQTALTQAVLFLRGNEDAITPVSDVLEAADKFYQFLSGQGPKPQVQPQPEATSGDDPVL